MSAALLYRAAEKAGFDPAKGWPERLDWRELVALLTEDAPAAPWGRMIDDAVSAGALACEKSGELRYWRRDPRLWPPYVRETRALTGDEIAMLETLRPYVGKGAPFSSEARARVAALGVAHEVSGYLNDGSQRLRVREYPRLGEARLAVAHHDEELGPEFANGEAQGPLVAVGDYVSRPDKVDCAMIRWRFDRADVTAWLGSIGEAPGPLVGAWLGEAAKVGAGGTAKKKGGRPRGGHKEALERIVTALETYAAATGEPFDRWAMPGPLGKGPDDAGSFHWLCAKLERELFMRSAAAFKHHRDGVCAIQAWAKRGDFYRRALPCIAQKIADEKQAPQKPATRRKTA